MSAALLAARLVLASVLAFAGAAKLADVEGSRRALRGFRVPERLVLPAAFLVPLVELGIAVGLFPGRSARWGAIAAAGLLALFSAAIAGALARGEPVACRCFGQLSDAPAARISLLRNGVLAGLAAFAAFSSGAPGPGVGSWLADRSDAGLTAFWLGLALAALCVATTWFGRELLRQQGRLLLRLDALEAPSPAPPFSGLPVGAPAPSFGIDGWPAGPLTLEQLLAAGSPVALLFSDANCAPCSAAVPVIAEAQRELAGQLTVAVISKGVTEQSEAAWREHELENVGIVPDNDVPFSYGIVASPAAVLVSPEGRVESRPAVGLDEIAQLLRDPVADQHAHELGRETVAHVRTT